MELTEPDKTIIPKVINRIITMNNANPIALRYESKTSLDSKNIRLSTWQCYNYFEYIELIHTIGRILIHYECLSKDGISIYSNNSPEWLIVFLGSIGAGLRPTGIYPTDTEEQITFKIKDSQSKVVFVEDEDKCQLLIPLLEQSEINQIVVFNHTQRNIRMEGVTYFDEFLELDDLNNQFEIIKRQKKMKPDDICCYVYTSGTTGNPKGVMLSHDNLIFEAKMMIKQYPNFKSDKEQRIISYLPLSHIAGTIIDIICPIVASSEGKNINVNFSRADDLKKGTLVDRIKIIKPTLFFGVPRVWEKMKDQIEISLSEKNSTKRKFINWSRNNTSQYQNSHNPFKFLSNNILNKIKIQLGFDKCLLFLSGAAPLSTEVSIFYKSINISILELYGMSESTGAISCNSVSDNITGSVGKLIPFCEVKVINDEQEIFPVEDIFEVSDEQQGELCFRGRNIMSGYWGNPTDKDNLEMINQKNQESLQEGWLHSGDKGCVDKNGYIRITGRYKDIIIGSGGENISPVPIENKIKEKCPLIEEIVMVGDSQKFNIALLTLQTQSKEGTQEESPQTNTKTIVCKEIKEEIELEAARQDSRIKKMIYDSICETNNNGHICKNNCYKIQKFCILKGGFSVEGGELTSTLKIKRDYINKKYQDIIKQVYQCSEEYYYY